MRVAMRVVDALHNFRARICGSLWKTGEIVTAKIIALRIDFACFKSDALSPMSTR